MTIPSAKVALVKGKAMNAARGLKATILTLIGCVLLVFALDDTIKGVVIMDILFVVAYIAAIATAWIVVFREDDKSRSLPVVVVVIMTVVVGAAIGRLVTDINVAASKWNTLSTLPDPGRWNSTLLTTVLTCVTLLLITTVKPSSPKRNDDDNKG